MAEIECIKKLDALGVGDGQTAELSWTADEDYIIHKIIVAEEGGNALSHTDATIRVANVPLTKPEENIANLQAEYSEIPELRVKLPEDQKIVISLTNHEGATRSYNISLYLIAA